jgi:hypothetical protein
MPSRPLRELLLLRSATSIKFWEIDRAYSRDSNAIVQAFRKLSMCASVSLNDKKAMATEIKLLRNQIKLQKQLTPWAFGPEFERSKFFFKNSTEEAIKKQLESDRRSALNHFNKASSFQRCLNGKALAHDHCDPTEIRDFSNWK